eukprot:scaffold278639_cov34-Prasinocladus_malaysianus.AAC.1
MTSFVFSSTSLYGNVSSPPLAYCTSADRRSTRTAASIVSCCATPVQRASLASSSLSSNLYNRSVQSHVGHFSKSRLALRSGTARAVGTTTNTSPGN